MKQWDKLFKKTSTGAIQTWRISVVGFYEFSEIITEFGQLNGKIQTTKERVTEGKNEGKSNSTNHYEQAILQSESEWKGKLKKGYVESIEAAQSGEIHDIIEGGIFPMLAHKYSEQGHKIKFPAIAQPKFDGHRCIAQCDINRDITLWSRTRKPITGLPHIIKDLRNIMIPDSYLDGELYNHKYHDEFEKLSHFIRQEHPTPGYEIVQYHVYDLPHKEYINQRRDQLLNSMRERAKLTSICIVESIIVNDEDDLMNAFQHFLKEGYEGAIVRNMNGLYVNKRSYDLLKVKEFSDDEFIVTGVKEGKGSMEGKAIFICKTKEGSEFSAKMIGSMEELRKYVDSPFLAIGKMLTVKYQGLTNKNNVPRFPVAVRFKEEEE